MYTIPSKNAGNYYWEFQSKFPGIFLSKSLINSVAWGLPVLNSLHIFYDY